METGEDMVQGSDYYYTLQGWLKGINVPGLTESDDLGRDGHASATNLNRWAGRDEYALGLGYYENDYRLVKATVDLGAGDHSQWVNLQSHILEKQGIYGMFN